MFVPRIWGMRSLAPLFPGKTNLPEPIGEVWLTGVDCKVATGPFAGKTLGEAWREMPAEWRGTRFAQPDDFPILIKFIFPNDKLSIQVHPDDAYAAAHEKAAGGRGKTEMWHVLSADPGAQVLVGLKPGVDEERFLDSLKSQTLEGLLQAHRVRAGDTFFVPAGTPHTIGSGMIICEVQEYSDLTYRVYDYGRIDAHGKPRELHIEKALEVMDFGKYAGGPIRWSTPMNEVGTAYVFYLAACRYFVTEKWEIDGWAKSDTDLRQFELLVVTRGRGVIHWEQGEAEYSSGESWFVPASVGKYMLSPFMGGSEVLRIYVPDLPEFERSIAARGWPEDKRRLFIFS